jgi:mono/diheme cytochrome c family protein
MRSAATRLVTTAIAVLCVACGGSTTDDRAAWRADCAPLDRPAPLSREAARDAQRLAARKHELRLREAAAPGSFMRDMRAAVDPARVAAGQICPAELADLGQLLFEHEYGFIDGLGGAAAAKATAGPFRRVHGGSFGGPETISCPSCHWVGGPNGAGAETDGAFLEGDGIETASGDERNPPALMGLGVVQALAREMTRDLQQQRADFVRDSGRAGTAREVRLSTKGVDFGVLRLTDKGEIDASGVRGVDGDLVVKPFGWKGTLATFADFAAEALQVHIGIQSDVLLASASRDVVGDGKDPADPDGDGVRDELGRGPFEAMVMHMALLEMPIVEPMIMDRQLSAPAKARSAPTTTSFASDFQHGRKVFHDVGCAGCHVPMMVLESPILALDGMPPIDLSKEMRQPRLRYEPRLGGYPVWLFSDLKRHDMGKANAARHVQRGVALEDYLTPRLWGVADSEPYLHDGRAPSFDYAIAGHDGEGAAARAALQAAPYQDRAALRVYLMSLRRAPRVIVP